MTTSRNKVLNATINTLNSTGLSVYYLFSVSLPSLSSIKARFNRTGTASVVETEDWGVSIKDEGDFISVRLGSNGLAEIGSFPTAERNFASVSEALAFVESTQKQIREQLTAVKGKKYLFQI